MFQVHVERFVSSLELPGHQRPHPALVNAIYLLGCHVRPLFFVLLALGTRVDRLAWQIAIDSAVFPEGTSGAKLDVLARKALWQDGLNYMVSSARSRSGWDRIAH